MRVMREGGTGAEKEREKGEGWNTRELIQMKKAKRRPGSQSTGKLKGATWAS